LFQSGGDDDVVSDDNLSRDGDSPDTLSRVPASDVDPETLEKLRRQVKMHIPQPSKYIYLPQKGSETIVKTTKEGMR
jgi:hypothetical protein